MNFIKNFTLIAFAALTLVACNSDDDNNEKQQTNQELLIGNFKITSISFNGENEPFEDCYGLTTISFTPTNINATAYEGDNCEELYTESTLYVATENTITVGSGNEANTIDYTITKETLITTDRDGSDVYSETYTRI